MSEHWPASGAPPTPGCRPRLWVIGLDGATFDLIEPWVARGYLPTFAHLLTHGAHGPLYSPVPQSPPAWASFMTGKNPGKHGIFDFVQPAAKGYETTLVNGGLCRAESVWHLLSRNGRKVDVVNVPMTYPPEPVNGSLIAGFDTPHGNADYTHPPGLYAELQSRFGGYTFFPQIAGVPLRQVVENFHRTIDLREQVMAYLLQRDDPDFFMMVFNSTDSLQHLCLQSLDERPAGADQLRGLRSIYERLDQLLGRLVERLPADTALLVVSDHGAGPLRRYINLDRWLAAQGWLTYAGASPALAIRQRRARWAATQVQRLRRVVPGSLRRRLRRMHWLKAKVQEVTTAPHLDWARTRAYSCGQGIYLNVRGRQPAGVIEPGAGYEAARVELAARLHELRDPETGVPIVARVWNKEDLFPGVHNESGPDVYIHWRDDAYLSWVNDLRPPGELFHQPHALGYDEIVPPVTKAVSVGCHRQKGIFVLFGNGTRPGPLPAAQIVDVVPTMLALMGEAIPADLDGRVLQAALSPAHLERFPIRYRPEEGEVRTPAPAYSDAETEMVERRLREMGYL